MGNGSGDCDRHIGQQALEAGLREAFSSPPEGDPAAPSGSPSMPGVLLRDLPHEEPPMLTLPPPGTESGAPFEGRYEIVGEIARGAVGVIYKVRDRRLGRDLALKVLREDRAGDEALVERFIEEAQVEGQLQHPGIVPVYGLGLHEDGRPFIAMKLIKGRTVASLLRDRRHPREDQRRFLGYFERLCQAMAYAHSRGVVHRDLKPSNVMVGPFGEVQVVDWGFAKVLGEPGKGDDPERDRADRSVITTLRSGSVGSESVAGSVMGTPAYMPPEQALGQVDSVDRRSDVFALGAVLCEVLTGQPPYVGQGEDLLPMAAQGRLEDAWARLEYCEGHEAMLDLCRRALAPLKRDRPADASEVARAVAGHLAELERRARAAEVTAAERRARIDEDRLRTAGEHRMRRRTVVAYAALLAVAVIAGAATQRSIVHRRDRARRTAERVDDLKVQATEMSAAGDLLGAISVMAEAVARAETEGAEEGVVGRTRSVLDEFRARQADLDEAREREVRDRAMVETLEETRCGILEQGDAEALDAAYRTAFAEYGLDILGESAEDAAQHVRESAIREDLIEAIDSWGAYFPWWRNEDATREVAHLFAVVSGADPDPFRCRIRMALHDRDRKALEALGEEARPEALPARTSWMLATALNGFAFCEKAHDLALAAVARHPGDLWLNAFLAAQAISGVRPDPEEAIRFALAAIAARPTVAMTYLISIGDAHFTSDRPDEARAWYEAMRTMAEKAVAADPGRAYTWLQLAQARARLGDYRGAHEAARRLVDLKPESARSWLLLSSCAESLGDWSGAVEAAAKARDLAATSTVPVRRLANLHRLHADFESAHTFLHEALDMVLDRERDQRWDTLGQLPQLGIVARGIGDLETELAIAQERVRRWPNRASESVALADAYMALCRIDDATDALKRTISLSPSAAMPRNMLAHVLVSVGTAEEFRTWDVKDHADAVREAIEQWTVYRRLQGARPDARCGNCTVGYVLAYDLAMAARDRKAAAAALLGAAKETLALREAMVSGMSEARDRLPGEADAFTREANFDEFLEHMEPALRFMRWKWPAYPVVIERLLDGQDPGTSPAELCAAVDIEWMRGNLAAVHRYAKRALAQEAEPLTGLWRGEWMQWMADVSWWGLEGWSHDAGSLDEAEKAEVRAQSLEWMREALAILREHDASSVAIYNDRCVRATALNWMLPVHPGNPTYQRRLPFPGRLESLPAAERAPWEAFWEDVRALVRSTWKGGRP